MYIEKALFFITIFFTTGAMEVDLPPSRDIKKIIKRWNGQEQLIARLFHIAKETDDIMAFRTIDEELVAVFDDKKKIITTYCKNKTKITLSYGVFIAIMDHKEELKKAYNQDLEPGLCSLQ